MRPELKKIVDAIKAAPKHYIKLEQPIQIAAGTKWKHKSSSGTITGQFKYACNIIAVRDGIGYEAVLDRKSSIDDLTLSDCDELWKRAKDLKRSDVNRAIFHGSLAKSIHRLCDAHALLRLLSTGVLKQIADQIKA